MVRIFLFIFGYFTYTNSSFASNQKTFGDSSKFIFESKIHYGFVISHHKYMTHLTTSHFPAFEFNIGKQTNSEKTWQSLYDNPIIGVSYWYADLKNPNVLGSAHALYPYLNFHIYKKKSFIINYRFGIGIAYLTKKFDRFDNYKNIAIGSHLNASINMCYEFKWQMFKKIFFSASIGITHFSNGAIKLPNPGINIPSLSLGLAYPISVNSKNNLKQNEKNSYDFVKKTQIISVISGSIKEIYPTCGDKYGAFSLSTFYLKPLSFKRKIGAGIDLFWDFSNIRTLKRKNIEINHSFEAIRFGFFVGHQFDFSKLSFITHLGCYAYAKDKSDGLVYSRIGLRYNLNKKLLLNLTLKTHFAKADFLECGFGYRFF